METKTEKSFEIGDKVSYKLKNEEKSGTIESTFMYQGVKVYRILDSETNKLVNRRTKKINKLTNEL